MTAQATLDWQHEIHHAIIAALPNRDYELIAFNQAKSTESIYANVLHGQRLFDLRFPGMRMNARAALPMLLLICAAMAVIVSWLQVLEKFPAAAIWQHQAWLLAFCLAGHVGKAGPDWQ